MLLKAGDPVGTIHTRKDGTQWMKVTPSDWAPVKTGKAGPEHDDSRHGLRITKDATGTTRSDLTNKQELAAKIKEILQKKKASESKSEINKQERTQRQEHHIEKKQVPKSHEELKPGHVVRVNPDKLLSKEDEKKGGIVGKIKEIKGRIATLVHAGGKEVEVPLSALAFQKASFWDQVRAMFKAGKSGLVARKVMVTRDGRTYQTTVYVKPEATEAQAREQAQKDEVADYLELKITRFGEKAIVIVGETLKNLAFMRQIKQAVGIGGYNDKLKGWVFPASAAAKIKALMDERFAATYVPSEASAEQKEKAEEAQQALDFDTNPTELASKVPNDEAAAAEKESEAEAEKVVEEQAKQPVNDIPVDVRIPDTAPAGYVDVGEKIGGARKDVAALEKLYRDQLNRPVTAQDLARIEGDNPAVAQQLVNKYRQAGVESMSEFVSSLRAAGTTSPGAAIVAMRLFKAVTQKPSDNPMVRQNYIEGIRRLTTAMRGWASAKDAVEAMNQITEEMIGFHIPQDVLQEYNDLKAQSKVLMRQIQDRANERKDAMKDAMKSTSPHYQRWMDEFTKKYPRVDVRSLTGNRRWLEFMGSRAYAEFGDYKLSQEDNAPIRAKLEPITTRMMEIQRRGAAEELKDPMAPSKVWGALGDDFRKALGVLSNRDSSSVQRNARASMNKMLVEAQEADKKGDWSWLDGTPSEGAKGPGSLVKILKPKKIDWARYSSDEGVRTGAESVTYDNSTKLLNDFGLRGVEYGNWMDDESSRNHTQRAGEAFHDLATVLGIDKKEISLNGRLSLAFGARGKGNALAHYEPGRKVINMTKLKGGGSLAHEWGHALDNIIALVGTGGQSQLSFATTDTAAVKLTSNANYSAMPESMKQAVQEVHSAMWEGSFVPKKTIIVSPDESRRFRESTYYNNLLEEYSGNANLALAAEVEKDDSKRSLKTRSWGDTHWGRQAASRDAKRAAKNLKLAAEYFAWKTKKPVVVTLPSGTPTTSFAATAKSSSYLSDPCEMFARAFEAYVHDKLKESGIQNSYLTKRSTEDGHLERRAHADPVLKEQLEAYKPLVGVYSYVPQGAERVKINNAIQKLVDQIKLHQTLQKASRILDGDDKLRAILKAATYVGVQKAKSTLIQRKITGKDGITRTYFVRTGAPLPEAKKKAHSEPESATWRRHLMPSEAEYVKITSGDQNALAAYWNRTFNQKNPETGGTITSRVAQSLAAVMTRGKDREGFEVEDIAQEVGLRLLRNQQEGKITAELVARDRFPGYVAGIMNIAVSEIVRKRKAGSEVAAPVEDFANKIAATDTVESQLFTEEPKPVVGNVDTKVADIVQEVIRSMPTYNKERNKQIFKHYLAGMSHRDIAQTMGITEQASRKAVAVINKKVEAVMQRMGIPTQGRVKVIKKLSKQYIGEGVYKMAARDVSKLQKKTITNRAGKQQTVYVRVGEQPAAPDKGPKNKPEGGQKPRQKGGVREQLKQHVAKLKEAQKLQGQARRSAIKDAAKGFLDTIFSAMKGQDSAEQLGETAQTAGSDMQQNEKRDNQATAVNKQVQESKAAVSKTKAKAKAVQDRAKRMKERKERQELRP